MNSSVHEHVHQGQITKILLLFERAMFEDYSFKNRMKIFLLFMAISPL